jgi:hypothetical protein
MQVMRDQDHRRVDTAQQVAVQKVSRLYTRLVLPDRPQNVGAGIQI